MWLWGACQTEKFTLYNNTATWNDCAGRLSAELAVYPTPRITWEFELPRNVNCSWSGPNRSEAPIRGNCFFIDRPHVVSGGHNELWMFANGVASEARSGDLDVPYAGYHFYLPNARFQAICREGQHWQEHVLRDHGPNNRAQDTPGRLEARYVIGPLSDGWTVSIQTNSQELEWLDPDNANRGTYITSSGTLAHSPNGLELAGKTPRLSLRQARQGLVDLSQLLSFANGGYVGPIYIGALNQDEDADPTLPEVPSSMVMIPRVTPLEEIGDSWLTYKSNLGQYFQCLPALQRMLHSQDSPWAEAFELLLSWYLHAIQPQDAQQWRKPWPVRANAVGAALERISYTVLVLEELNPTERAVYDNLFGGKPTPEAKTRWNDLRKQWKSDTVIRLIQLLVRIGLTQDRGCTDTDQVREFVNVRNDATHSRQSDISNPSRERLVEKGLQWLEETLLWRLGYTGSYRDRSDSIGRPITPRYDLASRHSTW
jgi:hypothetical protein